MHKCAARVSASAFSVWLSYLVLVCATARHAHLSPGALGALDPSELESQVTEELEECGNLTVRAVYAPNL